MSRKVVEIVTDMDPKIIEKSSKTSGTESEGGQKLIGNAETRKGNSLSTVEKSRYVYTEWGGGVFVGQRPPPSPLAPCFKSFKNHFTVLLGVFTHTPPEGGGQFTSQHRSTREIGQVELRSRSYGVKTNKTTKPTQHITWGSWLSPTPLLPTGG